MSENKKKKVLFPFVEAGLGHIMPMRAVFDVFKEKYGNKVDVVDCYFFQYEKKESLIKVEQDFVAEVKKHNKYKYRGPMSFLLMRLFGQRNTLNWLFKRRYKYALKDALSILDREKPDLVFNTHLSTLYYACEAKHRKMIDATVVGYCPDPIIGLQWDNRADLICVSSYAGIKKANESKTYKKTLTRYVPFLIRKDVEKMTESKDYYKKNLGIPTNKFLVLLADGAYGAGKLEETVKELFKTNQKISIAAVCGKNEALYERFKNMDVPSNIDFYPYGFTDKTLELAAAADLFVGKAGASNLAEPTYFGVPSIVNFCATPIEKWISNHYTDFVKCSIKETNIKKVVELINHFITDKSFYSMYSKNTITQRRADGPELLADLIWEELNK